MNVLWITNITPPEALKQLGQESDVAGGWIVAAANELAKHSGVKLCVASVSRLVERLTRLEGEAISYYLIPYGRGNIKYNRAYEAHWKAIAAEFKPDVVHIHGTEFTHGLAYVNACGAKHVVVSIQGLKSAIGEYYAYGLDKSQIRRSITFHDLVRGGILREQKAFKKSGRLEAKLLQKTRHIIGRTSWDRTRTWSINPQATYHFCNESLRDEFYCKQEWDYSACRRHTIFVSQCYYPIKGLHQLLKAMPLVLRQYPDAQVRVAGNDITRSEGLSGLRHFTGYGKIVRQMIRRLRLSGKVVFLGSLTAAEMRDEYLKANVFVCPSAIENSPNSLGEAQILGVPCVASYVGGTMDMMQGNEQNLYRFEETAMLACKICSVFQAEAHQHSSADIARKRHDRRANALQLLSIYREMTGGQK